MAGSILVLLLKGLAWWWSGSVGLLADALESTTNIAAASLTVLMLRLAQQPADGEHAFGHGKAEYLAAAVEGALVMAAAAGIAWAGLHRLGTAVELGPLGPALLVSVLASAINLGLALLLLRAGRRLESMALEADARHLLADVATSAAVLLGLGLVLLTGQLWIDAVVALLIAGHVAVQGGKLIQRAADNLLDRALDEPEQRLIQGVLDRYRVQYGLMFHALRTRRAGPRRFVSLHVLVPGDWSVLRGHELLEELETELRQQLPGNSITVFTHLEPIEADCSWHDLHLDRRDG